MTINQLIKKLQKIEKEYGKRTVVVVCIEAIKNCTPDHLSHGNINEVQVETIVWEKDDCKYLADGSERMKTVAVIGGL